MLLATRLAHAFIIVVFCFATIGCGGPTKPTETEGVPEIPAGERTPEGNDTGDGTGGGGIPARPPE